MWYLVRQGMLLQCMCSVCAVLQNLYKCVALRQMTLWQCMGMTLGYARGFTGFQQQINRTVYEFKYAPKTSGNTHVQSILYNFSLLCKTISLAPLGVMAGMVGFKYQIFMVIFTPNTYVCTHVPLKLLSDFILYHSNSKTNMYSTLCCATIKGFF